MKKIIPFVILIPALAYAVDSQAAVLAPPDWLSTALILVQSIPVVGVMLAKIFMWSGVVSSIMTAVSIGVQGVLSALASGAGLVGLADVSAKIKSVSDIMLPWLKYLSMFNVQKKE